jgi:hypothetical protein
VLPALPELVVLAPPAPVLVELPAVPLAVEPVEVGLPVVLDGVPPVVAAGLPGVEFSPLHAATSKEPKIQARRLRFMSPSPKWKVPTKLVDAR